MALAQQIIERPVEQETVNIISGFNDMRPNHNGAMKINIFDIKEESKESEESQRENSREADEVLWMPPWKKRQI